MLLKIIGFIGDNWNSLVLLVTTLVTLVQAFQIKVLQKKVDGV